MNATLEVSTDLRIARGVKRINHSQFVNEGFLRYRCSMIAKGIIEPPK
jgi:hypothetical protein